MAMATGGGKTGSMSDINVTPMIDVLLVLLVIFMIAQPLLQRSIDVQVPKKELVPAASAPKIVLEINANGLYTINTRPIACPARPTPCTSALSARLREIYSARADRLLFIRADSAVQFQEVISAMDAARGAGVEVLGAVL
jgi:biopolymer transport protein ExbD